MKKCIVCSKELENNESKFCYSCTEFFKWKYGKNYSKELKRFERILKSTSTKFKAGGKT